MASIKLVLRQEEKEDGTYPLAIRITKDRKSSYVYLEYSIDLKYWDTETKWIKKTCPNYHRMNNYLLKKLAENTDKTLEIETSKNNVSVKAIRQKLKPSGGSSFSGQAKIFLDTLEKSKKHNQWSSDKPRISHFKEFCKGDIGFEEITPSLLKRFAAWLKDTRNISDRSIMNNMVVIRSVFSQAIAAQVTDAKYYPFGKGKFKVKFPDSLKIGLVPEEVKILEDADLSDPRLNHARNIFLFSFYFAGMRISDVFRLQWSDFKDGRLYYLMGKNNKGDSLKVPVKALEIIEQYQRADPKHDLVFPDLESVENFADDWQVQKRIKSRTRRIGEYLDLLKEEINKDEVILSKKLDPHISRHTFGGISGNQIPVKTLQKLYRHTHLSTTAGYQQNFTHEEMDNALDKVIGAV